MSLFKLDERREKLDERTEKTKSEIEAQKHSVRTKVRKEWVERLKIFVGVGAIGFIFGVWQSVDKFKGMSDGYHTMQGFITVTTMFMVSGIIALIFYFFQGKWKAAFIVTCLVFIILGSFDAAKEKRERLEELERRYGNRK